MRWWNEIIFVFRRLNRGKAEQNLDEEIRTHLDMEIEDRIESGVDPVQARAAAQKAFGSVAVAREDARAAWGFSGIESILKDIKYGVRVLLKSPAFTLTASASLALAIGANAIVFSAVYGVLLRPLPFRSPDRVVVVKSMNLKAPMTLWGGASPADFVDLRKQNTCFEAVAADTGGGVTLTVNGKPESIPGARVSEDYFTLFGVPPLLGRTFQAGEFLGNGSRAIILSFGFWRKQFGGDPSIVGRSIVVDKQTATVVGVMPSEFRQPAWAAVWTPLPSDTTEMQDRGSRYFTLYARIKDEFTMDRARAELSAIGRGLANQYPQVDRGWTLQATPLRQAISQDIRAPLLALFAAVAMVLLIACTNIAGLLLARGARRQGEFATRAALGASRARILRQLMTENFLLGLLGSAAGLAIAFLGASALKTLIPRSLNFPRLDDVRVDLPVFEFTIALALVTCLVFGLLPALRTSSANLVEMLKTRGDRVAGGLGRMRAVLVAAEIALTLVLLSGAGLMARSFVRLSRVDCGFDTRNLLTVSIGADLTRYADDRKRGDFYNSVLQRVRALPGVRSAALNSGAPFYFQLSMPFSIQGRLADTANLQADYSSVSPDFFSTMGIRLLKGRAFSPSDIRGVALVAIINETMSKQFFADSDPIGKHLLMTYLRQKVDLEVVGVVADAKQMSLADQVQPEIYACSLQLPWLSEMLVVHTAVKPLSLTPAIESAVWSVDGDQPVVGTKTIDQLLSDSVAQPRFYAALMAFFSVMALLLAALGVYGIMSYMVSQRTHEMGVRIALGASRSRILQLAVGRAMLIAGAGVVVGLAISFLLPRFLASILFQASGTDVATLAATSLVVGLVAALASYLPARRAMKIDPVRALRYE